MNSVCLQQMSKMDARSVHVTVLRCRVPGLAMQRSQAIDACCAQGGVGGTYLDAGSDPACEQHFAGRQARAANSTTSHMHCPQRNCQLSEIGPELMLSSRGPLEACRAALRLHVRLLQRHRACDSRCVGSKRQRPIINTVYG